MAKPKSDYTIIRIKALPGKPLRLRKAMMEKVFKAAEVLRSAQDSAKAAVALDHAASTLQDVIEFPEDLRGGSLDELLAYLASTGATSRDAVEAAEGLLRVDHYDEYDKPKIDPDQRNDLADALQALGKGPPK